MFNNIILTILLSLHFSACTSNTTQSNASVVEEPTKSEQTAKVTPITNTAEIPTTNTVADPEPAPEKQAAAESVVKPPVKKKSVAPKEIKNTIKEEPQLKESEPSAASEALSVEVQTPIIKVEPEVEKVAEKTPEVDPAPPARAKPDHKNWNSLLAKYVNNKGDVNYAGFKADKNKLQAYLTELTNNPPETSWSRNEKMAFWINAYNAYTIKLIVDNYPTKSITSLKGGKPWDVKWIKIGTETYSLNNIENDILRPQYKDARIHFAVNCAAESCPPLLNKAWTANQLNSYFEQQAKAFINNPAYNKITANKVQVSKIFDWYKEDFDNLIVYLNKYSNTSIKANAKVEFLEYDWALNKQ
ncbi:MAG: hypothetical protein Sapg2KO_17630 [Saprospiraceae bacterium]